MDDAVCSLLDALLEQNIYRAFTGKFPSDGESAGAKVGLRSL